MFAQPEGNFAACGREASWGDYDGGGGGGGDDDDELLNDLFDHPERNEALEARSSADHLPASPLSPRSPCHFVQLESVFAARPFSWPFLVPSRRFSRPRPPSHV